MQRTLLQVVQQYLDATSGFYVDSIFDTDESQQVANVAERIYYKMVQEYPNLLFTMQQRTLDSLADVTKPNYLAIPKNIQKIQESKIFYDVSEVEGEVEYREVIYLPPVRFMEHLTDRQTTVDTEIVVGFDNTKTVINNKDWPRYCTSFDNVNVVFDAYNSEFDSVMQSTKSKVLASSEPVFLQQDDFVIPVPDSLSETYMDMVLDECMDLIYQQPNARIAQRARAARIKLQQDNRKMGQSRGKNKYGRSSPITNYIPRGHRY